MSSHSLPTLAEAVTNYLNHDAFALDALAEWVRDPKPPKGMESAALLKQELRHALDHPSCVTPQDYDNWTGQTMEGQDAVQQQLEEMWAACFE